MAYSRQPDRDTWVDAWADVAFAAGGWLHRRTGHAIRAALRFAARTFGPLSWPLRFALMLVPMAAFCLAMGYRGIDWAIAFLQLEPESTTLLEQQGLLHTAAHLETMLIVVGWLCVVTAAFAWWRRRLVTWLLKIAGAAYLVAVLAVSWLIVHIPNLLFHEQPDLFGRTRRDNLWLYGITVLAPWLLLGLGYLLCLVMGSVYRYYRKPVPAQPLGDRIVENLDTHGDDPTFRTSLYWISFLHLFVLFLIPLLVRGCDLFPPPGVDAPPGGSEELQEVQVKRVKKKEVKEMVLNPNSPIQLYRPKIEESKVLEDMQKVTEHTYAATGGKGGKGKGGGIGWGGQGRLYFYRLEHGGSNWDVGMGKGADYNLLLKFHQETGLPVSRSTESITAQELKRLKPERRPAFLYLTGNGAISLSSPDIRIVQDYVLKDGGMLFADNGGGSFDSQLRRLLRRLFPDLDLVTIPYDDEIFRNPHLFENGAPPLAHHSGNDALGLRANGRWIVFYHQGDMKDVWADGHNGNTEYVADRAYKMGINVMVYAYNRFYGARSEGTGGEE